MIIRKAENYAHTDHDRNEAHPAWLQQCFSKKTEVFELFSFQNRFDTGLDISYGKRGSIGHYALERVTSDAYIRVCISDPSVQGI